MQFSKDATFFHILKNGHDKKALEVVTQDYFISSLKPYMHELSIRVRFFKDESSQAKFIGRDDYTVKHSYIRQGEGDSGSSSENIITISNLVIPPQAELIITYGVRKSMMNFEEYPNDPQRGFNLMHMPVLYREFQKKQMEGDQEQVDDSRRLPWKQIESAAMLVQIPEPDFSMPFNVNAVTLGVLGVFMINMYNSLVKPKRFLHDS